MKKYLKLVVLHHDNTESEGETYRLTLCGTDERKVVLELNESQFALLKSRTRRAFFVRCPMEKILQEIDNAPSCAELNELAAQYYLCDVCDLSAINFYGAKKILKAIVRVLYKYPKLRSRLCYIGTHHGLENLLIKLEEGDEEVINHFRLQYIATGENAGKLGGLLRNMLAALIRDHERYIATAMSAFGLLDSVLFDKNDYEGYAYIQLVSQLGKDETAGFHPKGCHVPESIVYHELGHLLDHMCGLGNDDEFTSYYKSLTADEIRDGLSEYALKSPAEFIAEALAELMCGPDPRPIAQNVGRLLDLLYKKA